MADFRRFSWLHPLPPPARASPGSGSHRSVPHLLLVVHPEDLIPRPSLAYPVHLFVVLFRPR